MKVLMLIIIIIIIIELTVLLLKKISIKDVDIIEYIVIFGTVLDLVIKILSRVNLIESSLLILM